MSTERTLSREEVEKLLVSQGREPYKMIGHSFQPMNGIGKQVCKGCGLVALRNAATDWCVEKGCRYEDHGSYKSAMKRLTKSKF